MDSSSQPGIKFHIDVLPPSTARAFELLSKEKWLDNSRWYLAGGTALALQVGHRKSVDLDFFTQDKDFNNDELLSHFVSHSEWQTDINSKNTIYGVLCGAKVSFIAYPFFIPKVDQITYGAIRILRPRDIAVMKVIAISQRGRKRDFIDLYWLVNNGYELAEIISNLKIQYPFVAHDLHHILKSMVYFEDAENDPMPELNFNVGWNDVKNYFLQEIPKLTKLLFGIN